MSQHGSSTENAGVADRRAQIEKWLTQAEWKIRESPHHPKALWVISARSNNGLGVTIAKPRSVPNRIEIQAQVGIGSNHQKLIAALEIEERTNLWWRIHLELLKMEVSSGGFEEPVTRLWITSEIYEDGLTQDSFIQRVTKVKHAQMLIFASILQQFDQPYDGGVLDSDLVQ